MLSLEYCELKLENIHKYFGIIIIKMFLYRVIKSPAPPSRAEMKNVPGKQSIAFSNTTGEIISPTGGIISTGKIKQLVLFGNQLAELLHQLAELFHQLATGNWQLATGNWRFSKSRQGGVFDFNCYVTRGGSLDCYEVLQGGRGVRKCSILALRNI